MFRCIVCFVFALLFVQPGFSQEILSISFGGTLTRWDVSNDAITYREPGPSSGFAALAKLNDGRWFATRTESAQNTPSLFRVNPETGDLTLVGNLNTPQEALIALTGTADGKLLSYNSRFGAFAFYKIDPDTLATELVQIQPDSNPNSFFIGTLATAPDGRIFTWAGGSVMQNGQLRLYNSLFEIDIDQGVATEIGRINPVGSTSGMTLAFTDDGELYGFTDINGGSNNGPLEPNSIYQFDLDTGIPTRVRAGNGATLGSIRGAEFITIPEPSSLALILVAGVFATRRRCSHDR
ncbi:MAG: PEP-CTERM sorting domain-containing protein [Phycisphaeraceae bacterium]